MKNEKVRVSSSKCLHRLVCCASLIALTLCFSTNVWAEKNKANKDKDAIKRGDMVMGTVVDVNEQPMTEIKVLEYSVEKRVTTYTTTDSNGDFALKVYDPKDSIRIKIKGYETITVPLDKKFYTLTMVPAPVVDDEE